MLIAMSERNIQRFKVFNDLRDHRLSQIDGSHHDWFEARSDKCCLLVFIDDATGFVMNLRFSETEPAFGLGINLIRRNMKSYILFRKLVAILLTNFYVRFDVSTYFLVTCA